MSRWRPGLVLRLFRGAAKIQRKRMVLTVTAIAWGTISIVLLLSFGEGLRRSFEQGQQGLGDGIAITWAGQTQKPFAGFPPGRQIDMRPEDVGHLLASVPEVAAASGEMRRWGVQISYRGRSFNKRVTGVEPAYRELRSQHPQPGGRFIDPLDQLLKRRVIFLGDAAAEEIFGDREPVGETVLLDGVPFTVIGVMRHKLQMGTYGGPDEDNTIIPLSTFEALMGRKTLSNLVWKPASPELMETAKARFYEVMGARYRFDPADERALPIWDTLEGQEITAKITIGINLFLGLIGALTLLIGGVGVANIMYAAVTARTREIGILMAIGARRSWVMGPLVLEALTLTFLGGVIGIGLGAAIVQLLALLQSKAQSAALEFLGAPTLSLPIAATTVAILGGIGWLAGWFPSRRATAIHPARVLRAE